ncbi:hypothetical protein ES708_03660 [subsurface metagenome]
MPEVGIGDSVCDRYTGTCGRIVDVLNDEVLIEPTRIKEKIGGIYTEEFMPPVKTKKVNLELNHIIRYEAVMGFLPMPPDEGPPLPRRLNIRW